MGLPQNGWFIFKILLKWMIQGYPYFRKPPCLFARSNVSPTLHFVSSVSGIPCRRVCLRVQKGEAQLSSGHALFVVLDGS